MFLCAALLCARGAVLRAEEWSEKEIIDKFESQSPQARALKARVAAVEADARTRTA
jgi:hypothetical protein